MSGGRWGRSAAEWVTFGISMALLLAVALVIAAEIPRSNGAATPVAVVRGVSEREGRFFVRVEVVNRGDRTAENVQVAGSLVVDGEESDGDQTVDFLSGGETEELEFVFDEDPAEGELTVRVTGFLLP